MPRLPQLFAVALSLVPLVQALASAPTFTDVTLSAGITHNAAATHPMTGGAAAGDLNGDGWVDLFVTRYGQTDLLYLNDGNGAFTEASFAAGFTSSDQTNGVALGDIDNDGDLDVYLTRVGRESNLLYVNDGQGRFTEQSAPRGADVATPQLFRWNFGATFADYDNDGWLDLYTTQWGEDTDPFPGESSAKLLRNTGGGFFSDQTVASGAYLEEGPPAPLDPVRPGVYAFSPRFADLDRDGHVDLTVASDFGNSRLFWNNGDGTFVDGTATGGVGGDENGMGSAIADYDNDGRLDWFVTSIDDANDTCSTASCNWGASGNRLYRNAGGRSFADATDTAGVRDGDWGWGAAFLDYDNDGQRDLVMTNGIDFGTQFEEPFKTDRTTLWRNDGAGAFVDVSAAEGVVDAGDGKGLVVLDYDQDGDQDLFVVNRTGAPVLYRNESDATRAWLRIDVEGTMSNRDGLGAQITVTPDSSAPSTSYYHEVNAGANYLGHDEKTAHFGLGEGVDEVDLVEVHWPARGVTQRLTGVATNQLINVTERLAGDFDGDGAVTTADYDVWRTTFGETVDHGAAADGDGDGRVDASDYTVWRDAFVAAAATVPEPGSATLALIGVIIGSRFAWRAAESR